MDVLMVVAGRYVKLRDGSVWKVVDNPRDGIWLIATDAEEAGDSTDMVLMADVVAVYDAKP